MVNFNSQINRIQDLHGKKTLGMFVKDYLNQGNCICDSNHSMGWTLDEQEKD